MTDLFMFFDRSNRRVEDVPDEEILLGAEIYENYIREQSNKYADAQSSVEIFEGVLSDHKNKIKALRTVINSQQNPVFERAYRTRLSLALQSKELCERTIQLLKSQSYATEQATGDNT